MIRLFEFETVSKCIKYQKRCAIGRNKIHEINRNEHLRKFVKQIKLTTIKTIKEKKEEKKRENLPLNFILPNF